MSELLTCPVCWPGDIEAGEECEHLGWPYRELFVMDGTRHPSGSCGFVCSVCVRDVDEEPCRDHAPAEVPGLRLVECDATPRHVLFAHDRDDYGYPCPVCDLSRMYERERLARQCRHWPWRRWRILRTVDRYVLRPLGLSKGYSVQWGDGHDACRTWTWRWSR